MRTLKRMEAKEQIIAQIGKTYNSIFDILFRGLENQFTNSRTSIQNVRVRRIPQQNFSGNFHSSIYGRKYANFSKQNVNFHGWSTYRLRDLYPFVARICFQAWDIYLDMLFTPQHVYPDPMIPGLVRVETKASRRI